MGLLQSIKDYFAGNSQELEAPETHCPNCWGRQEYAGKFLEALDQEKIDLNNADAKQGWIQGYATRHFEGIKLKETDDAFACPSCKLSYRPSKG